jgi:YVTN family beta-propeller protein
MRGRPFAPRYWRTLRGVGMTWGTPAAGRDPAGYTFWQRYWAALTVTDLPARTQAPEGANGAGARSTLDGRQPGRAGSLSPADGPDLLDSKHQRTQRARPDRFRVLAPLAAALAVIAAVAVLRLGVSSPSGAPSTQSASQSASASVRASATASVPASLANPTVTATVAVGNTPSDIQVAPNGEFAYISSQDPDEIAVLDTATGQVTVRIPISQGTPQFVSFSPDSQTAYVSVYNNNGSGTPAIVFINTTTGTVTATVPVNNTSPGPSTVSPNGRYLYVPNHDMVMGVPNGQVIDVIDTVQRRVVDNITVPMNPQWIVFGARGQFLYVSDHMSHVVTVLNSSTNSIVDEIPVGATPYSEALSPDGSVLAVTSYDGNFVTFIDTATSKVITTVKVGDNPQACAYAPDGRHLYVVNNVSNTITVIDTANYQITDTIRVGSGPTSIAVLPNGLQAYVANADGRSIDILDIAG